MASLNKVFLIGNLTKDPVVRKMPSGEDVADMRLAVNRRFRDKSGKDREETLYINVTVFGSRAGVVGKYLRTGSPILIEGRLKYEEWADREGKRQSRISVVAENFEFLGSDRGASGAAAPMRGSSEGGSQTPSGFKSEPPDGEGVSQRRDGGGSGPDEGATPWRGAEELDESGEESQLPF